jgi:Ser/Thr protein kinase RdoA (MazF antagonist)
MSDRSSSTISTASPDNRAPDASAGQQQADRDRFEAFELAIVLSHYGLGAIESIQDFPRGSRRAPKLLLNTEKGPHLLKRRARGQDDPYKVAFCHDLQLHLASRQFPLPRMMGTRHENNSMLQWDGRIYEVFEYIAGEGYNGSAEATQEAGKTLGLFHKLLQDHRPQYDPAKGS